MAKTTSSILAIPRNFIMVIIASYLIVLILAYFAGSLGFATWKIGNGFIIVIAGIALALIIAGIRDFKVERAEIFYFILVMATLIGIFFLLKNYVPSLFAIQPQAAQNLQSTLSDKIVQPIFSIFG